MGIFLQYYEFNAKVISLNNVTFTQNNDLSQYEVNNYTTTNIPYHSNITYRTRMVDSSIVDTIEKITISAKFNRDIDEYFEINNNLSSINL